MNNYLVVDQPKFQRHIVLIVTRGGGVPILKNVPIKMCPNWAKGGRGKLNWDNVLKSAIFFLTSSLMQHQFLLPTDINLIISCSF